MLINVFFPPNDRIPIPESNPNACINVRDFTYDELRASVMSMSVGKAPEIDWITNEMIKRI